MKRMQCEVCGSTSIKKVSDTAFECQSCGIQYSKEEVQKLLVEVTGSVKIDHSNEVENALKRAAQFEQEGDAKKAEQYYQKVLDLDPENSTAKQKIEDIKKENAKPQNMYILERTISAEKAFDSFLNNLRALKNIAPDIYKEIEIISKTETYYPFAVMHGTYSGTYSGTACFEKEVPYLDVEVKDKLINGKWVKVKETVTKYRTEIDKKPASGSYSANCRKMYSLSKTLDDHFSDTCLNKIEKPIDFGSILEEYFDDSYKHYCDNIRKIDIDNLKTDIPVFDLSVENEQVQRALKLYEKHVKDVCSSTAYGCVGGDKSENVRHSRRTISQEVFYLYIPIQVVEYAYKGDFYISTIALVEGCKRNNLVYPYYNKIDAVEKKGNQEVDKASHKGLYGFGAWIIAALAGFLGWWTSSAGGLFPDICNAIAIGCVILGVLQTTLGVIKLIRANKLRTEYQNKMDKLSQEKNDELKNEFKLFFNNYKGIDSIEKCTEIIRKSSTFSCTDDEISCRANNDYFDDYDVNEDK